MNTGLYKTFVNAPRTQNSRPRMKGQAFGLNTLLGAAVLIAVLIIVISISAQILGEIRDSQDVNSTERNITGAGLDAFDDFADWFAIIVIVVIAVVIIGLLLASFGGLARRGV